MNFVIFSQPSFPSTAFTEPNGSISCSVSRKDWIGSIYVMQIHFCLPLYVRWPLTVKAPVRRGTGPCRICGEGSDNGSGFSQSTSVSLCQYHSTNAPYSIFIRSNTRARAGNLQNMHLRLSGSTGQQTTVTFLISNFRLILNFLMLSSGRFPGV